jgi:hypothetical protein
MKIISSVKWDTIKYLQDPKKTKLPDGYTLSIMSTNRGEFKMSLWNGNKPAGTLIVEFVHSGPNHDKVFAVYEGGTYKNYRGKSIGTLIRALLTKAALNSNVNEVHHEGVNIENLAAKSLALRQGISINNAKKLATPISTRIVRKLGYEPTSNHTSRMTVNMNRAKLNNAIKQITAAINIQRAYRRHSARG